VKKVKAKQSTLFQVVWVARLAACSCEAIVQSLVVAT
jgi:hypothetical protein